MAKCPATSDFAGDHIRCTRPLGHAGAHQWRHKSGIDVRWSQRITADQYREALSDKSGVITASRVAAAFKAVQEEGA